MSPSLVRGYRSVVIQASSDLRQMGADGAAAELRFWEAPKGDDCSAGRRLLRLGPRQRPGRHVLRRADAAAYPWVTRST